MKTLYISDLDGTLLTPDAEISEFTVQTLNQLMADGLIFSIATARSAATADPLLKRLNITTPVILMNGVCIYDLLKKSYIKTEVLNSNSCKRLFFLISQFHLAGFLFSVDENKLSTFYERADTPHAKAFIEEREKKYGKYFKKVTSFHQCFPRNMVYFSVADTKDRLIPFYENLKEDHEIHIEFYRDVYNENHWYLEVCAKTASKYTAVAYLKEKYGFDKVVSFGDNLNDMPLFDASDESYAVENAKPQIKEKATAVIAGNKSDGVAKFLMEIMGKL